MKVVRSLVVGLGLLTALSVACRAVIASETSGRWENISANGTAYAVAADPRNEGVVYASTAGGVFKSTNWGADWVLIRRTLGGGDHPYVLVADPATSGTLYVAGAYQILRTRDGGTTWERVGAGLEGTQLHGLVISPSDPGVLYATTLYDGIYRSSDGAENWTRVGASIPTIEALAVHPRDPRTVYAASVFREYMYVSRDGGKTWQASNEGLGSHEVVSLAIDQQDPSKMYAGTRWAGVYKSVDGGQSWSPARRGLPHGAWVSTIATDPRRSDTLYAASPYAGIFKSEDGGDFWRTVDTGMPPFFLVTSIMIDAIDSQMVYMASWGGGIMRSENGGVRWVLSNRGISTGSLMDFAVDPRDPTTLYALIGSGWLVKSRDSGVTWQYASAPDISRLTFDPSTPRIMFGVGRNGIYRSGDSGVIWKERNRGLWNFLSVQAVAFDPFDEGRMYAHSRIGGLFASHNGGSQWRPLNRALIGLDSTLLVPDPGTRGTLYLGTKWRGLYKSTDGGLSWKWASEGVDTEGSVNGLFFDTANTDVVYMATSTGLYRSDDAARTWQKLPVGDWDEWFTSVAITPSDPRIVYAGSWLGLYRSADAGVTWTRVVIPGADSVEHLVLVSSDPVVLYVDTGGSGLFKWVDGAPTKRPEDGAADGS